MYLIYRELIFASISLKMDLFHSLGKFSRQQIDDIFLIFARNQDLTFHANCLYKMSNSIFRKNKEKEKCFSMSLLKFLYPSG